MAAPRKAERMKLAGAGKAQAHAAPGAARGSYPTDTPGRARAAKSYASAAVNEGRMSAGTERGIDARANRELGKPSNARIAKQVEKRVASRNDGKR